jgi:putative ABC transport system permease protein
MDRNKNQPPPSAQRLLLRFLRDDLAEEVLGDLDEKFYSTLRNRSVFRAKLNYWYQVLQYVRPFAIRKSGSGYFLNDMDMFKNYFTIGWRNLARHKMYSAINIGGFAVGIAACLLIAIFIRYELTYDRHYANTDRIYRILRTAEFRGESNTGVWFSPPMIKVLQEQYPEFEKVGHYIDNPDFGAGSHEVRRIDQPDNTHEDGFVFMDQGLLEVLEMPFILGNPSRALTEPNSIVITRSKAEKYFKGEDPIGKTFILDNNPERQYTVTGVVEDFPLHSHLQFNFFLTLAGKEFWVGEQTSWCCQNYIDYVRVRPGTDIAALEQKLHSLVTLYMLPDAVKSGSNAEGLNWLKSMQFKLQPVQNIHMNREGVSDDMNHGDIRYIWLFGSIAGFILFLACINFINLSTARSANRAKEVGLRKVIGSVRSSLIKQFLTESLLFSLFAFVLALLLMQLTLPFFNLLIGKSLYFPWNEWWIIPVLTAGIVVIGIIAGIYPAFFLSSFTPVQVLKGKVSRGAKSSSLRNLLVVFQFTISIILIIGTLIIDRQMNYILNKKLGFDKDHVLLLQGTRTLEDKIIPFKNELVQLADVKSASISGYIPVAGMQRNGGPIRLKGAPEAEKVTSQHWSVDPDYVKTMGMKIVQGRDFSSLIASDSQALIINQSLVKSLNLKDPIGQQLNNWLGEWTIIGVIEDFHSESLKENIQPMALYVGKSINTISVKINTADMAAAVQSIEKVWKKFSPHQPIRYAFLDQQYAHMYDDVKRTKQIFTIFAILAIVVACLGLFALSAFMVEQRSKEISIRLVLGASLNNIFRLLTTNFVLLVLISFVIATPISVYLMQKWLEDYVYKTPITADIFLMTGLTALLMAITTISYQSIRAALTNPVNNLKSE